MDRLDVQKEYEKRKADGKDFINLVVIGWFFVCRCSVLVFLLQNLSYFFKHDFVFAMQISNK